MRNGRFLLGVVLLFVGLVTLSGQALAGDVGYVDFEYLFNAHPEYASKNQELQATAENLTQEFQREAEQLESEEEVQALANSYEQRLDQFAEELRGTIIVAVQAYIGEVADQLGVSVVLPDASIIYGGLDLTPEVLQYMYDDYGISIPSHLRLTD